MKKALVAALCAVCLSASAENIPQIVGNLKDINDVPLPKVKITTVLGKANIKTDKLGNFYLSNVAPNDTLLIHFNQEKTAVPVNGRTKIAMRLAGNLADLLGGKKGKKAEKEDEEMIDTGYGKVRKVDYSNSNTSMGEEEIKKNGYKTLIEAVRAMGVSVDADGNVQIRGVSSFNLRTSALLLCDDIEIDSLLDVEINDVKSIEILKEGDLYGSKGANGVVVIRTSKN